MVMKKKKNKMNTNKILITVLTCSFIMLFGLSYAWYHINLEGEKEITLTAGSLQLVFDDVNRSPIHLENTEPMSDEAGLETDSYRFSIKNTGSIDSNFTLYLDDMALDSGQTRIEDHFIKYVLFKEEDNYLIKTLSINEKFTTDNGVVSRSIGMGTISAGETQNYILKLWISDAATKETVANKSFHARLRLEAVQKNQRLSGFVDAYTYSTDASNGNYCITGKESTCQKTTCYQNKTEGSCPSGTIINYKVNDTDEVFFHVMFDDGDTLTMQSQQTIVDNIKWNDQNDLSVGPMVALTRLEEATAKWTNVNDQTYTMGTTIFKDNAYTFCSILDPITCSSNVYVLPERTSKVRMITIQEALVLGCTRSRLSCPIWMYNYMGSTSFNGEGAYEGASYQYFTMNAANNPNMSPSAMGITNSGGIYYYVLRFENAGVRAVVNVSK